MVRNLVGATDGAAAAPGTIRGDYGMSKSFNLIHASDGAETAAFEMDLWFGDDTLDWDLDELRWVNDPDA